jgi:predicted acetyltransferase
VDIARGEPGLWDDICDVIGTASGEWASPERRTDFAPMFVFDRIALAREEGRIIGVVAALPLTVTLPGLTQIPVAGLTGVAVLPAWRRRGVLGRLMEWQLADARRRGEAVSALIPSQGALYGRFGYGPATRSAVHEIRRGSGLRVRPAEGSLRMPERAEAARQAREIYEAIRPARVGELSRPEAVWGFIATDPGWARPDGSPAQHVTFHDGAAPAAGFTTAGGFMSYRLTGTQGWLRPSYTAEVRDLFTRDGQADAALLNYLLDLDLVDTIRLPHRPLDDPVRWQFTDPDDLRTVRVADHLWLRVLNVRAALSARRYATAGRLVLRITHRSHNEQVCLDGGPEGATCTPSAGQPDLVMELEALGAVYLGGASVRALARAGLVRGTPEILSRADAMFHADPPPWCSARF